jgi:hypothetical protein
MKALDELRQPRPDTLAIMAKGLNMSEADFTGAAAGLTFADLDLNQYWLARQQDGKSRAEALFVEAGQLWRAENLSNAPTASEPYFNSGFAIEGTQP